MVSHINSTQAQQAFGKVIDQALAGSDVVVERYGRPRVAIISSRRYEQLLEAERQRLTSQSGYLRVRIQIVNGDFLEAAE